MINDVILDHDSTHKSKEYKPVDCGTCQAQSSCWNCGEVLDYMALFDTEAYCYFCSIICAHAFYHIAEKDLQNLALHQDRELCHLAEIRLKPYLNLATSEEI